MSKKRIELNRVPWAVVAARVRLGVYALACIMCAGNAALGFVTIIQGGDGWSQLQSSLFVAIILRIVFEYQSNK